LVFENFQAHRIKEVIKKKLKINEPLNIGRNHLVRKNLQVHQQPILVRRIGALDLGPHAFENVVIVNIAYWLKS
jgi:hypothetical protein